EGHRGAFLLEDLDGLVGLGDGLVLAVGQLQRLLHLAAGRLLLGVGLDGLVGADGAVADLDLHAEHALAAGLELGQQPLDLLVAQLVQELLELLLGVLQLLGGRVLILAGPLAVVAGDLVFGLALVLVGVLDLLAAGGVVLLLLVTLLAALLTALLAAALARTLLAALLLAALAGALLAPLLLLAVGVLLAAALLAALG